MRLCRTCRFLASREAVFCPHCARSFDGRRCAKGHLSPPFAVCCQICGTPELSEATGSIPLGFVPLLLSGLLALGAGALLLRFGGGLLAGLESATESVAVPVLGGPTVYVWRPLAERILQFVLIWTVIFFLIPGKLGQEIRRGVGRLLTAAVHLVGSLLSGICRLTGRLVSKK